MAGFGPVLTNDKMLCCTNVFCKEHLTNLNFVSFHLDGLKFLEVSTEQYLNRIAG